MSSGEGCLTAASRGHRLVFVAGKQPFGFRVPLAGMSMRDADRAEQRCELAVRVEVTCAQRNRALTMLDQMTGSRANRCEPVGDIVRVSDRGGEEQHPGL